MNKPKAYLDCIEKTIKFKFKGQDFEVELAEGDLEDSWNSIRLSTTVSGDDVYFDTNFAWGNNDEQPTFSVYPIIKKTDDKFPDSKLWDIDTDNGTSFDVVVKRGSYEDYFSIIPPNGFVSFCETLSLIMRDATTTPEYETWVSRNGQLAFFDVARQWAMEFEEKFKGVDWGIEDSVQDWDEELWDFTLEKLKNL